MKSSITSKGKEAGHGAGGSAAVADLVFIGLLVVSPKRRDQEKIALGSLIGLLHGNL